MRTEKVNIGLPILGVSYDGQNNKVGLEKNSSIVIIDANIDGTALYFTVPEDGPYLMHAHINTSSGEFDITRPIVLSELETSLKSKEQYIVNKDSKQKTSTDEPVIPNEVYQNREEVYEITKTKEEKGKEKLQNIYDTLLNNLENATNMYISATERVKNLKIDIEAEDEELYDSLVMLGFDPSNGITGKVILTTLNMLQIMSSPFGYEPEEYLLLPLNEDGQTVFPAYTLDESKCKTNGQLQDKDKDKFLSRSTVENMLGKKSVWKYVAMLWPYIFILILKFIMKLLKKISIWPIKYAINAIIHLLNRLSERLLRKISQSDYNKLKENIQNTDSEHTQEVDDHLYLKVTTYDDNNGKDKYPWCRAFRSHAWAIFHGYANLLSYPDVEHKRKVIEIDIYNDYVDNGNITYGENILSSTPRWHRGRLNHEKYEARENIAKSIISQLGENLSQDYHDLFSNLLIDANYDLDSKLSQLLVDSELEIYIPKDLLTTAECVNGDISSLPNRVPLIETFVSGSYNFKPGALYINPNYVLIRPDNDSLKMKKIPIIRNAGNFDIDMPDVNLKGVKRYINPFCQKAAVTILKTTNNNRKAVTEITRYELHKTNLEVQSNQALKKVDDPNNKNNEDYKEKVYKELDKTDVGKKKKKFAEKIDEQYKHK